MNGRVNHESAHRAADPRTNVGAGRACGDASCNQGSPLEEVCLLDRGFLSIFDRNRRADHALTMCWPCAFFDLWQACMTGELWNRDTGELVCRNTALYGNGTEPLDEKGCVSNILQSASVWTR